MSGFVLNRNMELQLPASYVEIESSEMEYIDGGKKTKFNTTGFIGTAIDAGIIGITGGTAYFSKKAASKLIRQHRGAITRVVRKQIQKHIGGAYASAASSAIDFALTVGGASIGSLIAEGLDRADGRNDGYVFG
ncbi:hypothetical protein [Paraclostridium sp. AKS81]|uniref:hypothetical protein n=1 Tax=Paraclostridium sp. AKS81 TaxID=2876117 RepID=UPI0021E0BAA6|nr:hypothetical protein [Paraclostridium sp. AKS81]MCU9813112.1 hypothetical protein [Paraclostridium sp. AKS81]